MALTGPLTYFGGKKVVAKEIVQRFPAGSDLYLEPFFGGGGVYFQIPRGLFRSLVVNDLNRSIVTFYRVLRDRPEDLVRACTLTPYALSEQRTCRDASQDPHDTDELEVARRVWVRCRQNFGGTQHASTGWKRPGVGTNLMMGGEGHLQELYAYAELLRFVHFECGDATTLVQRYAKPGVFIYEDPPYHFESRGTDFGYEKEMTHEQHEGLLAANMEASSKGAMILISGYGGEFYNRAYAGWRRIEFQRAQKACAGADNQGPATEVLWANYPESVEIGLGWQNSTVPTGSDPKERALVAALRQRGKVR